MSTVEWLEDELHPRVDELVRPFRWWNRRLPVAHPEWFRPGDIVRVTTTTEALYVLNGQLRVARAIGRGKRQRAAARDEVFIIGNVAQTISYRRWWWRPSHRLWRVEPR